MKTIKKIHLKNIEINFQYENQLITLKVEPFKTLGEAKEKAIKKMICVPFNINCFYSNLDLSNDENKKIGDLFNHKEKVTIKLKQGNNSFTSITQSLNKDYLPQNNYNNDVFSLHKKIQNYNHKNIYVPKIKSIDKTIFKSKNLFFKNSSSNSLRIPKTDIRRLNRNRSDKEFGFLPVVASNSGRKLNSNPNFCQCGKYSISDYCRTCRKFICSECKLNDELHKNHLTIRLNLDNLENNINLYGNLIQTDIKNIIELNKNILQKKKEIIDINLLNKHKEDMNLKYKDVLLNYTNIMKRIKKYLDKENEGKIKLLVSAYNSSSVKIHKEIYDLIENLKMKYNDKSQKEIKFNELEYYLNEINKKESTLAFFKRDIIKYHLTNEINNKIKNSFNKINSILDEIINDENPFNLDSKYYQELVKMKIIKPTKGPEEENNINEIKLKKNNGVFSLNNNMQK